MEEDFIQSRQNPRVKALAKLRDKSGRKAFGTFLVEGLRELSRATSLAHVEEIYYCPSLFMSDEHAKFLSDVRAKGEIKLCELSEGAFEKVSNREGSDGLLGVVSQWRTSLDEIDLPADKVPLILVADAIEKPGNLGALMRTADSLGADALIITNSVVDIFNPAVVRSSQGALFSVKIAVATQAEVATWLKSKKIKTVGAHLKATKTLWQANLKESCAIVMGCEKDGLGKDWNDVLSERVIIPMSGVSDSMNVNVAASLCLYEALRQRQGRSP